MTTKDLTIAETISNNVKSLYESHPYPHYPLLFRPQWHQSVYNSSYFAHALSMHQGIKSYSGALRRKNILLAGSGEIQPYVMRKWEPAHHQLFCVDLSSASLKRAKMRLLLNKLPTRYFTQDIEQFLEDMAQQKIFFDHIDAYGVLHHLANPSKTLQLMADQLSEGGTMRLMVYNAHARHWIHNLQKVFHLLKIDYGKAEDLKLAYDLTTILKRYSPYYRQKFTQIGERTLANKSRFIDTFLHCRELRTTIEQWFEIFSDCQLEPIGIIDRYGELDDLTNPMWHSPTASQLKERTVDLRFENNLEIFLKRTTEEIRSPYPTLKRFSLRLTPPPYLWFSFPETRQISYLLRRKIWSVFLNHVFNDQHVTCDKYASKLAIKTLMRLARLGAILPNMVKSDSLRAQLSLPIEDSMATPKEEPIGLSDEESLKDYLTTIMTRKNLKKERYLNQILNRLKSTNVV